MNFSERHTYLLNKLISGQCSPDEKEELVYVFGKEKPQPHINTIVEEYFKSSTPEFILDEETKENLEARLQTILQSEAKVKKLNYFNYRSIAAAILLLIIGSVAYLWKPQHHEGAVVAVHPIPVTNDIPAPKATKATITLGNGNTIVLDSAAKGLLVMQGNVKLAKLADGSVSYSGKTAETEYNTLINPRGSKVVSIQLADGSQVWLNAESSLKYPTAFNGKTREVSISGEGYFEVAHDAKKPFIVKINALTVQVFGTHFNVNAYEEEHSINTTLLEGSVLVKTTNNALTLKPGQQAHLYNEKLSLTDHPDLDKVMAWRDGLFYLNNTDLPTIMRQISRWYDVDVVYESKPTNATFVGGISRNLPLSEILDLLKTSGTSSRLEGRKLFVKP